ncbi:3-hydroxyacyl-CoA dehydrogenase [Tistlia consotensis]|uniref:3-hydroxyacyl-CoA dehydrogenase n=1 Tax=Tistlia consotensis USBA 355 TaxID=560819 RepID=A0A1Y6BKA2_9PROT|nr:3-hydroxyacyl-CoA dehydrogenase [Tistlia consotensis]SMF12352.1 3-hydroxyacyl-CoA dehydrogenase [Tistlia consotensis USBA 355]SNR51177.1 3-hydroxyacyl-CoA dehydrogenase [Tistlia consotensis]
MTKIALVGSGLIGRAWAISFARAGFRVALWDREPAAPEAALGFVSEILKDLAAHDLLNGATPAEVLARIAPETDLGAALADAAHVQESTPEDLSVKRRVFAELDEAAPAAAVIASSSSALLPSRFTEALKGRARCLVVHPINPPYLIPAAEVVPAPWTSAEAVERTRALLVEAGHAPIVMQRELDGFVMNRLQGALLEEAFRLVDEGYASVEDVDIGIRDGLALRWSFIGPFETIDLNAPGGVADYVARYQGIYSNIFEQTRHRADWAGPVLERVLAQRRGRLPERELAARQLWRDRRLIALAAHKKQSDREFGK